MVCNDVKYCPEKDADSYYSRAGSKPFNLKPPGPGAGKKMLTRQFHCQSVTVAREYFRARHFFYSPSRLPWPPNIIISWHEFSRAIFRVFLLQKAHGTLTSWKIGDDSRKNNERNIAGSRLIKSRQITSTLCARFSFIQINV